MVNQTKNTFTRLRLDGETEKTSPKNFNIKISLTAVITVSVLFLICFGWSFVLGVMVGRDYDPTTIMPQLAEILPLGSSNDELAQENNIDAKNNQVDVKDIIAKNAETPIIKIEELNFASSLKGKPGQGKLAPASDLKKKNTQSIPVAKVKNIKSVAKTKSKKTSSIPTPATKMPKISQLPAEPAQKQKIYDFVIQVATFKNVDAADKLRASLEGNDLRTRMEKWQGEKSLFYSVLVVFRGTEAKAQGLNEIFKKLRLGRAIPKEKKLVE